MLLSIHQDYFWFFSFAMWGLAAVLFYRSSVCRDPRHRWIPWVAFFGGMTALVELSQLVIPALPVPRVPTRLWWDVALGLLTTLQASGLLWSRADSGRQRIAALAVIAAFMLLLAFGSQQWGEPVVQGVTKGRVIVSTRTLAEPPPDWLLQTGLALSAAFHWCSGWFLAGATLAGAAFHAARAWPDRLAVLSLSLVVAAGWFGSFGPVADFVQRRRAFTELSPVGAGSAVLQVAAGAAVLVLLLRRRSPITSDEPEADRREFRAALPWLVGWIAAGLVIAAAMGWIARRNFEHSALGRVISSAALLDRAAIDRALGPEFRLDRTYRYVTHSGRVAIGAISEHLGRGALRPLNDALAVIENSNPDIAFAQMLTLREGYLVACARASHIPAPLRHLGVQRVMAAADLAAWEKPAPMLLPPFALEYGEFVRALAPLLTDDGRMLGWLAFDFTVSTWAASQAQARLQAFVMVGLGAGLIVAWAFQRQLFRQRQRAAAADRAKTAFLGKVSHELRTPIQSILGYGEMLATVPLAAEPARWLAAMRDHGQLLIRLVNDLLDLSALQVGAFRLSPRPGRIDHLAQSVVDSLTPRAHAKGLDLRLSLHRVAGGWHDFDAERLRQILLNLVGNAVKFTPAGFVHVGLTVGAGEVEFSVSDSGPGIAPEDRPRLFQPFSRLAASSTHEGSGLGLALSSALCVAMGGTLTLDSDNRPGATFRARLPLPSVSPPVAAGPAPIVTLSGRRILVADDNTLVRELFLTFLRQRGAECIGAADGTNALHSAARAAFDVVIVDLAMPGADGFQVARQLRRTSHPSLRIVGVSAHAGIAERELALQSGMDRLLVKPVGLEELAGAVSGEASAAPFDLPSELVSELHRLFAAEAGRLRHEIVAAAAATDDAWLRRVAHYLRNSADIARLPELAADCAALEALLSASPVRPDRERVRTAVNAVLRTLDQAAP